MIKNEILKDFYSTFFKKMSFLSFDERSFYASEDYLASCGFTENLDFSGKRVLELGAGVGRLTASLNALGILKAAKEYIIVEPSEGIDKIREKLGGQSNLKFVRSTLEDLNKHLENHTIDYFIASGVIPHIDSDSLTLMIKTIAKFLADGGKIHVSASYHGYDKILTNQIKTFSQDSKILSWVSSLLSVTAQDIMCRFVPKLRRYYINNFHFSFQDTFHQRLLHQYEFYKAIPYNVYWSAKDYDKALSWIGYGISEIFPHSLAFLASPCGQLADVLDEVLQRNFALFGNDWCSRWFANKKSIAFSHPMITDVSEAHRYEVIIIAYDYTIGPPYYEIVASLENKGFKFGENVFFFQHFV